MIYGFNGNGNSKRAISKRKRLVRPKTKTRRKDSDSRFTDNGPRTAHLASSQKVAFPLSPLFCLLLHSGP